MFDIVTRKSRDLLHHFEHSRDRLLQYIRLLADDFIYDLVCQRQNALQLVQKGRGCVVVFILFLQELNNQALPRLLIRQQRATHLERDTSKTKKSLCDWIQLEGVNVLLVSVCGLTSAKTAPILMALSTALSVGPSIIGEYPSNNPSSSLSDERIDSACSNAISRLRLGIARRRTVAFAENRKFKAQRCSPTSTTSVFLCQI